VRAAGEVDMETAPLLLAAVADAAEAGADVELHLAGVTFMDSSGIRALLDGRREVGPGTLVLVDPSDEVRRVLAITGLDGRFTITSDGTP
jgi:anti-anti-sigma factor